MLETKGYSLESMTFLPVGVSQIGDETFVTLAVIDPFLWNTGAEITVKFDGDLPPHTDEVSLLLELAKRKIMPTPEQVIQALSDRVFALMSEGDEHVN